MKRLLARSRSSSSRRWSLAAAVASRRDGTTRPRFPRFRHVVLIVFENQEYNERHRLEARRRPSTRSHAATRC